VILGKYLTIIFTLITINPKKDMIISKTMILLKILNLNKLVNIFALVR